ncbi:hypothetical protein [Thermodesulfovibrio thiophilus]|uniref:hypothetical protein n=1 Tax=Thermodesulfovibrio thiophilus TaxID=340095 RepID=UPI0017BF0EAF|nr:hypothetical protein [Thermodesulfovibrio thiophilus]HHW20911.1 HAMP domain-containing histidine kinase [Thermodesulfovibrio thiophilus]
MSFQTRLFITLVVAVVTALTVINFVTLYFFIEQQQRNEKEIIAVYQEILKLNKTYPLPAHIKNYQNELMMDRSYAYQRLKEYSKTLLIWESILVLILLFLFYRVLIVMVKKERETEDFLTLLIFVLSHKIGNFISVIKTNIEILKIKPDQAIFDRLCSQCNLLNDEIKKTMDTIKKLPFLSKNREKVNVKQMLLNTVSKFYTEQTVRITARDVFLETNPETFETIIFLLLDNSFKYADSKVHIKIFNNAIAIRNDISDVSKGAGVGLQIVNFLSKKIGLNFKYRAKTDHFLALIDFQKR